MNSPAAADLSPAATFLAAVVLAVVVGAVLAAVVARRRRICAAAQAGRVWPALIGMLASWLAAELLSAGVGGRVARWQDLPADRQWASALLVMSAVLLGLWAAAVFAGVLLLAPVLTAIDAWLDAAAEDPWQNFTRRQRLRCLWRLHRSEVRLVDAAAAHLSAAAARPYAVSRQRAWSPAEVSTWLLITPGVEDLRVLREVVLSEPMAHYAEVDTSDGELTRIRVVWNAAALYTRGPGFAVTSSAARGIGLGRRRGMTRPGEATTARVDQAPVLPHSVGVS